MVSVALVNLVDEFQIRGLVPWQAGSFWKGLDDGFPHRLPHRLKAADDGSCRRAERLEGLLRYERVAFANIVTRRLHRRDDFAGHFRTTDAAKRSGKPASDNGLSSIKKAPKEFGRVGYAGERNLR